MSDISYIYNLTAAVELANNAAPQWHQQITGIPDSNPDDMIVRSITINNAAGGADPNVYMIWSSVTNGFIGSFTGANDSQNPQSTFRLNAPIPNSVEFRLYVPDISGNPPLPAAAFTAALTLHIDFIKYKRIAPHA